MQSTLSCGAQKQATALLAPISTRPCSRPFTATIRSGLRTHAACHASDGATWDPACKQAAPIRRSARQLHLCRATEGQAASAFDFEEPQTAREAIDLGLVLCKQEKWTEALEVFEKALNLPGTGLKRFRDKPAPASDGEKMAALYNIACCHSKLEDARTGLVALAGCLELGYIDFDQILVDPDLEFLRADPRFKGLVERFVPKPGFLGFDLGKLFGGNK